MIEVSRSKASRYLLNFRPSIPVNITINWSLSDHDKRIDRCQCSRHAKQVMAELKFLNRVRMKQDTQIQSDLLFEHTKKRSDRPQNRP